MYDFHIIKDLGKSPDATLGYEVKFDFSDDKLSGLPILVNKVMRKLLTSEGTDAFAPTTGSNIKTYLQGSNINNVLSLTTALNDYIKTITAEIKADELTITRGREQAAINVKLGNINISKIENASSGYNSNMRGIIVHLVITDNMGEVAYVALNAKDLVGTSDQNSSSNSSSSIETVLKDFISNERYDRMTRQAVGLD